MKLRQIFFAFAACSVVGVASLTGCASDAEGDDDAVTEESSDELNAAAKKLIGSYKSDVGPFYGLVLTSEKVGQRNKFFADVDTGVRCVQAPCPSQARIEGTFTGGAKTITLYSTTAQANVAHLLGKYNHVAQGNKLTLSRKGFSQQLSKETSYCSAPMDCEAQNLIIPYCMGGFACTPTSTCAWLCGAEPPDPCEGKNENACLLAAGACEPVYGSSFCSPNGLCTADHVYKRCQMLPVVVPPTGAVCLSSGTCAASEHCSTEDGVCNPYGMLAVCAGTCVSN